MTLCCQVIEVVTECGSFSVAIACFIKKNIKGVHPIKPATTNNPPHGYCRVRSGSVAAARFHLLQQCLNPVNTVYTDYLRSSL